jgi:hypothetical protein
VDLFEVAVRELVPCFGVFAFLIVDTQMPLPVFGKSVPSDELILLLGAWLMFTSVVPLVAHHSSVADEALRKLESFAV